MTTPVITSVDVPAAGLYLYGGMDNTLDFTINWDRNVAITGVPRISLTIGSTTRYANMVSDSGSYQIYSYSVALADIDSDGIVVNSLELNGGSIVEYDAPNDAADLTLNSVGSTTGVLVGYDYESDGGETLTSGSADLSVTLFFEQEFLWQTNALFSIEKTFYWDTSNPDFTWYRVQGCCRYPTAAGFGTGSGILGGCDVTGFQSDDASCTGALGKQQYIQNIVANGLTDLCQKIQDSNLRWEICSIKKFSRPADERLVKPDVCNTLTEIPFCQIPACINFCIQTDAIISMKMNVTVQTVLTYEGSGGANTSGSAITSTTGTFGSAYYEYFSDGGSTETSGSSETSSSWNGDVNVTIGMTVSVISEEVFFSVQDGVQGIPEINSTITTNCALCSTMPLILNVSHNLSKSGNLVNFLQRNGLSIPEILPMHYSSRLQSWIANYHLSGVGDDNNNSLERWRFSFDWSCTSLIAGTDLGSSYWKFSILIVRHNASIGTDFDTRLVIVFPPEQICNDNSQNFSFDFSFKVNTVTDFVSNDLNIALDEIILTDNIGLFKSKSWIKNPFLRINLTKNNSPIETQYQDIYSIFPKPVKSLVGF